MAFAQAAETQVGRWVTAAREAWGIVPLTQYELLDLIVGALSSIAITVTLLYAARQAAAAGEQSAFLSAQMLTEQLVTLDRMFIDHPELRPYFWEARPLEGADKLIQAQAVGVAELMLDVFQLALSGGGKFSARHQKGIHVWIVRAFVRSPVLRAKLRADQAWFDPKMIKLLAEAEARPATSATEAVRMAEPGADHPYSKDGDQRDP